MSFFYNIKRFIELYGSRLNTIQIFLVVASLVVLCFALGFLLRAAFSKKTRYGEEQLHPNKNKKPLKIKEQYEFRGKSDSASSRGEWIYGYLTIDNDNCYQISRFPNCFEFVISETVGQYSGCKDKNGTRIFEHDILWDIRNEKYCQVLREPGGFVFNEDGVCWNAQDILTDDFEIIGNIFDNPELIKKTTRNLKVL